MTRTEINRVYLVGTSRDIMQDVTSLLDGEAFSVVDARDGIKLLADPQSLAGNCVVIRAAGALQDGSSGPVPLAPNAGPVPEIVLVGQKDVRLAVDAVKRGASDVLVWPEERNLLLRVLNHAVQDRNGNAASSIRVRNSVQQRLTTRERDVLERLVQGSSNKAIGVDLGISERTVEVHRANIMRKLQVDSFAALIRLSLDVGTAA